MLRREEIERREETLRKRVRELSGEQRHEFYRLFEQGVRDPDTYAALNYLLIAGLHHFYLGRWLRGGINLVVFAAGVALLAVGLWPVGLVLILGITALELYALFRAQTIVKDHNNRLMQTLLDRVSTHGR